MPHYYRILSGDTGIYEAVDRDCPKDDPRRSEKPDGYWLAKVGPLFPNAISFWTHEGLHKYIESGLFSWHTSVVQKGVRVITIETPDQIVYQDPYQILTESRPIPVIQEAALPEFLTHLMHILD